MNTTTTAPTIPSRLTGGRGTLPSTSVMETGIADIDDIGAKLEALHTELADLNRRFLDRRSSKAMRHAEAADAAAFADAREAGRKDPGSKHVDSLRAELAEMARVAQGLHETIVRNDRAYRDAVAEHREDLVARTLDAIGTARTDVTEKIGELLESTGEVNRLHRMARWLDGGPGSAGRPGPLTAQLNGSSVDVETLIAHAGEALAKPCRLEPGPVGVLNESPDGRTVGGRRDTRSARRRRGLGAEIHDSDPTPAA